MSGSVEFSYFGLSELPHCLICIVAWILFLFAFLRSLINPPSAPPS